MFSLEALRTMHGSKNFPPNVYHFDAISFLFVLDLNRNVNTSGCNLQLLTNKITWFHSFLGLGPALIPIQIS